MAEVAQSVLTQKDQKDDAFAKMLFSKQYATQRKALASLPDTGFDTIASDIETLSRLPVPNKSVKLPSGPVNLSWCRLLPGAGKIFKLGTELRDCIHNKDVTRFGIGVRKPSMTIDRMAIAFYSLGRFVALCS